MKRNTKILVIVAIVAILAVCLRLEYANKTKLLSTVVNNCPLVIAEDSKYLVTADDCYQIRQQDGTPIEGSYGAKKLIIASKDGTSKRTIEVNESTFSFEAGYSIYESPDNKYVFLDSGTWLIHGAQVISMQDERMTTVEYRNNLFTQNGYFIYSPRSTTFVGVHPEVDMSDAMDVKALKLSDFSETTLCAGDATYNCSIGNVSADGTKLAIQKTKWSLRDSKPSDTKTVMNFDFK